MSTTTPNYGFIKPDYTDTADIGTLNTNFDKLDNELKATEVSVNKVDAITDLNKGSTTNYPSNKAVADYVASHSGTGDVTKAYVDQQDGLLDDKITEVKEDINELDEVKADKTSLDETDRSLDMLWKLSKGQTYDIQTKVESGMNVPPKGAKYETLLDVRGKSEQFTTNGYNLSDYMNNRAWSTDTNSFIVGKRVALTNPIDTSTNKNFTISWVNDSLSKVSVWYRYKDSSGNIKTTSYGSMTEKNAKVNLIVDSEAVVCYFFLVADEIDDNEGVIYDVMIVEGDLSKSYEPYTGGVPSPNPDYPQEITSVEEINFKKTGKNLFDISKVEIGKVWNGSSSTSRAIVRIPIINGSKYTISGVNSLEGIYYGFCSSVDTLPTSISQVTFPMTITASNNAILLQFNKTNVSIADIKTIKLQIERGSIATPYEPYREPTTHQIIPPFPLNGIGDVYDYADVDRGVWAKNFGEYTFNGSELWEKQGNFSFGTRALDGIIKPIPNEIIGNIKCENLQTSNANRVYSGNYNNTISGYFNTTLGVRIYSSSINSDNDAKSVMNGMKIVFEANTPIETPINSDDLAYLKSLSIMETDNNVLTITDQNGNDISYLMEYIIKLNEVN